MTDEGSGELGRRGLLRAGAGAVGAGLVGAGATGSATAQSEPFDGWLSDVTNYEGLVDMTGQDEVTVDVGVEANNGAFGFGPAAVKIDPGTTVVWEWTGEGGVHNVATEEGADFASENKQEAGATYEQTLDSEGVIKYFCQPHRSLGMKGVVVVGDVDTGAEVISGGDGGGGGGSGGDGGGGSGEGGGGGGGGTGQGGTAMTMLVAGSLVAAFLSPIVFGLILMLRDVGGSPDDGGAHGHGHED